MQEENRIQIKVAKIAAAGVILAAAITGIFSLMNSKNEKPQEKVPQIQIETVKGDYIAGNKNTYNNFSHVKEEKKEEKTNSKLQKVMGTVRGNDNNPIEGVTVHVEGNQLSQVTKTDEFGRFEFEISSYTKNLKFSYSKGNKSEFIETQLSTNPITLKFE